MYDSVHRCGETVICITVCTGMGNRLHTLGILTRQWVNLMVADEEQCGTRN